MENKIKIPDRKERRETDLYLLEEELKALKHESVSEYILAHDLSSRGRAAESEIRANLRKRPKGGGFLRSLAIASVVGGRTGIPALGVAAAAFSSTNSGR